MKYFPHISVFLFITGIIIFFACNKPDTSNNCNDPIREWPFPSTASRWLFDPIRAGDTLKFKVYRRVNRSSPYVYLREETFMIKDTGIQKILLPNTYTAFNCNEQMLCEYLMADITGPEPR